MVRAVPLRRHTLPTAEALMALIETLLMANHAEIHDGLLYLMGAGWSEVHQTVGPDQVPPAFHFGIGMTVTIGWSEATRRHHVVMYLEPEGGGPELFRIEADMDSPAPAGDLQVFDTRGVLAVNGHVQFPHPGPYRLAAELEDDIRNVTFRVHHDAPPG
jgi:hypothetical protein